MSEQQLVPTYSKVGDIFYPSGSGTTKGRPYIVVGVKKDYINGTSVLCIPLTTKESWGIEPLKNCRFLLKKSYFTLQIISFGMAKAQDHFIGIYENLGHLKQVKLKILKELESTILF